MLNFVTHGTATAQPPVLIAHGLFGSARNWGVIAKRLATDRQVFVVDMRNHGDSFWADSHSYEDLAGDLAEVIDRVGGPMDLVGHSMGGKAAMALALGQPRHLRRLVVADIAPIAYGHSQSHLIHAMRGVDLADLEKRSEADAQLARDVDEAGVRAFLLQSLDVKGKRWRLNLDVLERDMDGITGWPGLTGRADLPVFFLTGADSDYVLPEHRAGIKTLFPQARFAKIPGAGHWLHAEKPREFEASLRAFFDAPDRDAQT